MQLDRILNPIESEDKETKQTENEEERTINKRKREQKVEG